MCGFAGFCDSDSKYYKKGEQIAHKMADRIIHRGPDGDGYYSDDFLSVGFRRLKIIDLNSGNQPFKSADGRYILVFNGEIYNYRELKKQISESFNVYFKTNSDTEVLLYALIYYGQNALKMLRGMFAFVFYDRQEKTVFCARDPFGIKPFYYGIFDNCLLFGSEIKSFLDHPSFRKEFNSDILPLYLQFQYVPTEETAFKNVFRLKNGHYLTYGKGNLSVKKYYEFPFYDKYKIYSETYLGENHEICNKIKDLDDASIEIEKALQNSVKAHKISDVPITAFLSGGVDSSYICALSKPTNVYSVKFDDKKFDESTDAEDFSNKIGAKQTKVCVNADNFFNVVDEVQYASDEPYANLSAIPLYIMCKKASENYKVVLSGEGADELFGGYDLYNPKRIHKVYRKIPLNFRRNFAKYSYLFGEKGQRFLENESVPESDNFIGQAKIMSPEEAEKILNSTYKAKISPSHVTLKYYNECKTSPEIRKKMYLDFNLWLPCDILAKADKMSMASSVEIRVPYLDKAVFNVASRLDKSLILHDGTSKYALRVASSNVLPEETAFKNKKGFPVPLRNWLREEKYYEIFKNAFLSETSMEFFDRPQIITMLEEHYRGEKNFARILYTVFSFITWYDIYFGSKTPYSFETDSDAEEEVRAIRSDGNLSENLTDGAVPQSFIAETERFNGSVPLK